MKGLSDIYIIYLTLRGFFPTFFLFFRLIRCKNIIRQSKQPIIEVESPSWNLSENAVSFASHRFAWNAFNRIGLWRIGKFLKRTIKIRVAVQRACIRDYDDILLRVDELSHE